jgi:hypothetical protein
MISIRKQVKQEFDFDVMERCCLLGKRIYNELCMMGHLFARGGKSFLEIDLVKRTRTVCIENRL